MDIDEIFSEELREYMLRYCLRSKIYSVPERDMDKATKIIEQVCCNNSYAQVQDCDYEDLDEIYSAIL